jgi:hypothetical protein
MSDEIVAPQGDAVGEPPPTETPTGPTAAQLAAELESERVARKKADDDRLATLGRLEKAQSELNSVRQALGNQTPDAATTTAYQLPTPEPEGEAFDWDNPIAEINKRADARAQAIVGQLVPQIVGLIDSNVQPIMKMTVPDYDDIKSEVDSAIKTMGYQNITHARAVNPALVELAINAARGAKAGQTQAPAPAVPPASEPTAPTPDSAAISAEIARLERLRAAAIGGGAAPAAPATSQLTPEQIEHMEQIG